VSDSTIFKLQEELIAEQKKSKQLTQQLDIARKATTFSIETFMGNPLDVQFYTGLPDYLTFLSFCDLVTPRDAVNSLYYQKKEKAPSYLSSRGRDSILSVHGQIFLTLSRIKQGYLERDLAHRFSLDSEKTVSDIFSKWIKQICHMLKQLIILRSLFVKKCQKCLKTVDLVQLGALLTVLRYSYNNLQI
jgi:hypothetical protein